MEWWHIVPLVLAVIVFLLAGTVIEQHLEGAVLRVINRQRLSQATVGVETSACLQQDLQQQQEEWLQQEKLLQKQELQKGQLSQQVNEPKQQQQEILQHQQQELLQQQQQRLQKQQDLQKLLQQQHNETLAEVKSGGMKSLPNVNRQRPASQATLRPVVASAHRQQEPLQPQKKLLQEHEPLLEQKPLYEKTPLQQQKPVQEPKTLQRQPPQPQLSDTLPPLPFIAVSEKSILQPTSKTTVVSKAVDMQITKPNT